MEIVKIENKNYFKELVGLLNIYDRIEDDFLELGVSVWVNEDSEELSIKDLIDSMDELGVYDDEIMGMPIKEALELLKSEKAMSDEVYEKVYVVVGRLTRNVTVEEFVKLISLAFGRGIYFIG